MKMALEPELKVQMELDAHEKECAIRYQMVNDKLDVLDKSNVETRSNDNGVNCSNRWPRCFSVNENVRRVK